MPVVVTPVRVFLMIALSFLLVGLWLTIHNRTERDRTDRLRDAIERASYPGQKYDGYRAKLYDGFRFKHVLDWEKAEKTPDGRIVTATTGRIGWTLDRRLGPVSYDILVRADFDEGRALRSAVVRRRGHGL